MYDFDYHRPHALDAAVALLADRDDTKPLAGGMSLIPALKHRLAQYSALIDLSGIESLRGIRRIGDHLIVGAATPHAEVAASGEVARAIPALAHLAGGIGDPLVRNRGTIGGSIANADPAADYPCAVLGLGAEVVTHRRTIPGDAFFRGLFETALEPGELITEVRFPLPQAAGYYKLPQPASRFALVGVFAAKFATGVRVAVTGAGPFVFRFHAAEHALNARFHPDAMSAVDLSPDGLNSDIHASAAYRAHCVKVMTRRTVTAILAGESSPKE
jgi:carbon-monoxide dehydrogenase medium subunit